MFDHILSLIVAPIVVGIAIELFSHWLDEKDKDNDR
nr:type I toxin-antitoxin system Fst family toxin [Enterococcus sp. 665A]